MKAHMPAKSRLTKKQIQVATQFADELTAEKCQKAQRDMIRRWLKLVCVSLHQEFGFGPQRLIRMVAAITELSGEAEKDEIYWEHIDRVAIDELGLEFIKEK